MTRSITIGYSRPRISMHGLIQAFWPARSSRRELLDARELPDHLKRDLGILDGSRPVGSVCW